MPPTIYDLEFLNVCVDEVHQMRNKGVRYWAILGIRDRAVMVVATTATPLHTSPKVQCSPFPCELTLSSSHIGYHILRANYRKRVLHV